MSELNSAEMMQVQGGREASAPNVSEIVCTKDSDAPVNPTGTVTFIVDGNVAVF